MAYGSFINKYAAAAAAPLAVGDGMTECMWSDRRAYTVVAVSDTGKTAKVQEDLAIRTDSNGMSDAQEYRYERNPEGHVWTIRLTTKGWCAPGGRKFIPGRHAYHDFGF